MVGISMIIEALRRTDWSKRGMITKRTGRGQETFAHLIAPASFAAGTAGVVCFSIFAYVLIAPYV